MLPSLVAVFLGAFLLFLVQPLMGRFVLPWFGGSPGVWTACLLFFQTALLAGYAYAHGLAQLLPPRRQALLHGALLLGALFWLPPLPDASWQNAAISESPVANLVLLLFSVIGPPFILLAATGPLVQRWFSLSHPDRSPYRLYALSNLGSLLALLAYPVLLEPVLTRVHQAWLWSGLFGLLLIAMGVLIWRLQHPLPDSSSPTEKAEMPDDGTAPGWARQGAWVAWPAIACGLLASTTNALTLDVATVPFLWVMPLAVYLLSFILTFDHERWYRRTWSMFLFPAVVVASLDLRVVGSTAPLGELLGIHLAALAIGGWICHGELYRSRPRPAHLTRFYLSIAAGGALGTSGVALVSPKLFAYDVDLPLLWSGLMFLLILRVIRDRSLRLARLGSVGYLVAIILHWLIRMDADTGMAERLRGLVEPPSASALLTRLLLLIAVLTLWIPGRRDAGSWRLRNTWSLLLLAGLLAWQGVGRGLTPPPGTMATRRGFFGELTVVDYPTEDARGSSRFMAHGNTTHGIQLVHPDYRRYPTSYYSASSGLGRALSRSNQSRGRHIGVIGLGAGTIATYGMPGDHLRFYEIDPHVVELAGDYFTFLSDSPATIDIQLGDGRRLIEAENGTGTAVPFDLLIVDAFSSDAVPIHLLTREAMQAYVDRLDANGVIVVNISNRLVDLRQVLEAHAHHFGLTLAHVINRPETKDWWDFSSEWILLAPRRESLDTPRITEWTGLASPDELEGLPWTDEFASLWSVLR